MVVGNNVALLVVGAMVVGAKRQEAVGSGQERERERKRERVIDQIASCRSSNSCMLLAPLEIEV